MDTYRGGQVRRPHSSYPRPRCEAPAPGALFACTMPAGHAGRHSAGGTRDSEDGMCNVYAVWADAEEPCS